MVMVLDEPPGTAELQLGIRPWDRRAPARHRARRHVGFWMEFTVAFLMESCDNVVEYFLVMIEVVFREKREFD